MRISASASELLDSRSIGDHQSSASIVDQVSLAQTLGDTRYARPVDSKYTSDVLVRDLESVAAASALKCQQPTAEPLLDGMECVTDDALRQLLYLTVDIIVKQHLQSWIGCNLSFKQIARNDDRRSRDADLRTVCCTAGIEGRCDPDRSFRADDTNLDHAAVFQDLELGNNCSLGKKNVIDLVVLLIDILILRKSDTFEKLAEPDQMLRAKILNEMIARRS